MRSLLVALVLLFASSAVAQTDKKPIAEVIAKLSDPDPSVRSNAAWTLGRRYADDPARLDALEKAVSDSEGVVRANALGALGPKEVGAGARWQKLYLRVVADDADRNLREMAARFLTPADASTFGPLKTALQREKEPNVRNQLLTALVEGKMPGINDLLVELVATDEPGRALAELARSGDPRAIPALKAAAEKASPEYLNSAMDALATIKDPAVDDVMLAFLDGPKAMDALHAVIAVKRVDVRQAPALVKLWSAQPKASRKRAVAKLKAFDNMEDDHPIHQITEQLRRIAAVDRQPCDARGAAKGELKTYLTKILPKACGGS